MHRSHTKRFSSQLPAFHRPTHKKVGIPGWAALRLSKKPVIASQCAPRSKCPWGTHWRGNPFLKRTNSALFAGFCLKRYGFPRRFAPRNDRGKVYRHADARMLTHAGVFSVDFSRIDTGKTVCFLVSGGLWARFFRIHICPFTGSSLPAPSAPGTWI